MVYPHNRISILKEKEQKLQTMDTCNNTDESPNNYVDCKKAVFFFKDYFIIPFIKLC